MLKVWVLIAFASGMPQLTTIDNIKSAEECQRLGQIMTHDRLTSDFRFRCYEVEKAAAQ